MGHIDVFRLAAIGLFFFSSKLNEMPPIRMQTFLRPKGSILSKTEIG
jgi:hypothetical protein